jgi:molybdenum cofactor cytidylyltransferase
MIPGIILAAGRSIRMGRPKALMPAGPGGTTFVRCVADALLQGGVADALVVGRPEDDALRREVETIGPPVRFVTNAHADSGQLSSVVAGLNAADRPGVNAVLITPVDVPLLRADTVRTLLTAFAASTTAIARVTYQGRHGHPVVFARSMFDALRHADPARGAKAVLHAHLDALLNVEVDDPAVLHDIDRPEDYARLWPNA